MWLSRLGDHGAIWLVLGAAVALARHRVSPAVATLAAYAVADVASTVLKASIARDRPHVPTLIATPASHSFPSGHAASGFACALVLAADVPRLRAALLLLAGLIAFSRLEVGVHFPLDVIAGALLGAACAALVRGLRRFEADRRRSRPAQRAG